jgi:hypothetical protein
MLIVLELDMRRPEVFVFVKNSVTVRFIFFSNMEEDTTNSTLKAGFLVAHSAVPARIRV